MPGKTDAVPVIALVAAPKSGVLDSWYPVVAEARRLHPDWKFMLVFPRADKLNALDARDFVIANLLHIADALLFVGLDERLYESRNLRSIQRISAFQRRLHSAFQKVATQMAQSSRTHWAHRLFLAATEWTPFFGWAWNRPAADNLGRLERAIVLYDITGASKRPVPKLLERHVFGPRFSLHHGLSIDEFSDSSRLWREHRALRLAEQQVVYLKSHREVAPYRDQFGLERSNLRVVGVPRHDPAVRDLFASSDKFMRANDGRTVFLSSRPPTSCNPTQSSSDDWLPRGLKSKSLRLVHDFCEENGLTLVVRCHPSESPKDVLSVLPKSRKGRSWELSFAHPSQIIRTAVFAVTFQSGLPVEFLAFGVSTIELQLGRRSSPTAERELGLVLSADDEEQFRTHARAILSGSAETRPLIDAYRALYADPSGSVATILQDIEAEVRRSFART